MSLSLYAALGDTSKYVSTETNIPDQLTPVLSISPKDGVGVLIRNAVSVGGKIGPPIYGKFRDSNGNPLPANTRVALGYQAPTDESIQLVSDPKATIASYIKNSVSDQQDDRKVDAVKRQLKTALRRCPRDGCNPIIRSVFCTGLGICSAGGTIVLFHLFVGIDRAFVL